MKEGYIMGTSNFGKTLVVGLAAAATALLFAPKSGRELRGDLKDQGLVVKDKAMTKVNQLSDEFKQTYHEVEEEMNYANPDPELEETIADIETDLYHPNQEKAEVLNPEPVDLVSHPHAGPIPPDPSAPVESPVPPVKPDVHPTAEKPIAPTPDI